MLTEAVIAASRGSPAKGQILCRITTGIRTSDCRSFFFLRRSMGIRSIQVCVTSPSVCGLGHGTTLGCISLTMLEQQRLLRLSPIEFLVTSRTIRARYGRWWRFTTTAQEPDWRQEVELWILAEEIGQHFDADIREMFYLRILELGWEEIGKLQGLTAGQARLRFHRALEKLPQEIIDCLLPDTEERDKRAPQTPERGRT